RAAALRDHHAVATEGRHGAGHRTQVARVGDVIQRHDQAGVAESAARSMRSCTSAYLYGGICRPMPWCSPLPVMRSSSWRLTSRTEMPRLEQMWTASERGAAVPVAAGGFRGDRGTLAGEHGPT